MCQVTGSILYQLTNFLSCAGFYESLPGVGELCHVRSIGSYFFWGYQTIFQNSLVDGTSRKHLLYTIQGHKVRGHLNCKNRWGLAFWWNRGGGIWNSEKTELLITIRYKIPTFLSVGPFFKEGGEGLQKILGRSWNFGDFSSWGGPLHKLWS